MANQGKKNENFNILEDIYDGQNFQNDPLKPQKQSVRFKEYFKNSDNVNKLLSGSILFFGLAALLLGFFQINGNLRGAFNRSGDGGSITLNDGQITDQDLLGLREKDTDQDGISDYDELYTYATSPFLPDSDSDGVADQAEIVAGTDPNCPTGKNCFSLGEDDSSGINLEDQQDLLLGGENQVQQLRRELLQRGFTEGELNQLTDLEILQAYQQVLLSNAEVEPSETTLTLPNEDLTSLQPEQLRNLLRLAGVAESVLQSVSDQELLELVQTLSTESTDNNQ